MLERIIKQERRTGKARMKNGGCQRGSHGKGDSEQREGGREWGLLTLAGGTPGRAKSMIECALCAIIRMNE